MEKINTFLLQQDVTLSILFNVLDTNSDNSLQRSEFNSKLAALHIDLKADELEALFKSLDKNGDGNITYHEFISQFSDVNARQIIARMHKILYGANMNIE